MPDYSNYSLNELITLQHDNAAWYWLGMAYWENGDNQNAAIWLNKTMNDSVNEWSGKATLNLGLLNLGNGKRDEDLRLFESIPKGIMSRLYAGFLYYEGTETQKNPAKGKKLIEEAIKQLIKDDGDDEYLSQHECFRIAQMYSQEKIHTKKAIEYFLKSINRCNLNYESDCQLKEFAEKSIERLK
ncbi:MAG: hypothetical protein FWE14_09165 [Lachnospiraceae bacterium]|nr:hypothetical protein [Lachnospiraceae bacterium]